MYEQLGADPFSKSTGLAARFCMRGFRSCQPLVPHQIFHRKGRGSVGLDSALGREAKMHQVAVRSSLTREMIRTQPQRSKGRNTLRHQSSTVSLPTLASRSLADRVSAGGVLLATLNPQYGKRWK